MEAGRRKAAEAHASDKSAFHCIGGRDAAVYPSTIALAETRESKCMRKEVSKVQQVIISRPDARAHAAPTPHPGACAPHHT